MAPPPPAPTLDAIYTAYEAEGDDGFRDHLGASIISKECERALWYDFRWVTRSAFSGRMLRLFETGRLEEDRLVRDLRRTGATVLDCDPDTGRQWRVEAHGGHFGGSMDAVAIGLREAPATRHVVEFKTHNQSSLTALRKDGVQRSKPLHWAQMQVYVHLAGLNRAMYVTVCRDTDEIHIERVHADPGEGERLLARARRVIDAPRPPARISEDATWWQCRLCDHHDHCTASGRPRPTAAPACIRPRSTAAGTAPAGIGRSLPGSSAAAVPPICSSPTLSPASRSMPATTGSSTAWPMAAAGPTGPAARRRHDRVATLSDRRHQRDLPLLRGEQRQPADRAPDRDRQVDLSRRLHRRRHRRLAGRPCPRHHPRQGTDRPEPCRDAQAVAGGAGRHLLRRAEQARPACADPVRRHPVRAQARLRHPALRPGADR